MTATTRSTEARLERLRSLPFPEQQALIEEAVAGGWGGAALLRATAELPDHEPLAAAARLLARAGQASAPELRAAIHQILPRLGDTALQRLLRALGSTPLAPDQLEVFVRAVVAALGALDVSRIAALCLMDRWLKNAAPAEHARLEREALARVEAATTPAAADEVPDAVLARLPGRRLAELSRAPAWRARLGRFADQMLAVLERAPKSLSQANAEELLARQVYTTPGHFLIELLQNAEDAGATRWSVEVADRQLAVWHDGADFDARDVVGLLSIGQSTKAKGQIGFFGVGFKSVYEVCERPQVYSGLYAFEVADVSLPRRLGGRPAGHPPDGTLLVLPLRAPDDPGRRPDDIYRYACAVPAETLLTLDRLSQLHVHGPSGRSRTVTERPGAEPGRVDLVHEEAGAVETYLVASDRFAYAGAREANRAAESPVLVAVALGGADQVPCPLAPGRPTVFSYLPTGETSGLRFMVHAHFDLPVDRERLDLDSPWNRWALSCAGELLARCGRRLADEYGATGEPRRGERLRALLRVIPRAGELSRPGFGVVLERLRADLAEVPVLLGRAGERLRPSEAALVDDDALATALAGARLEPSGRRALAPLEPREAAVAVDLGARPFGPPELVDLLVHELGPARGGEPPGWLRGALPAILDALGRSDVDVSRLAGAELLPDQAGALRRPGEVARADPALRALYGPLGHLVGPELDQGATEGQRRLFDRLGVRRLDGADLVADLERRPELVAALTASPERAFELLAYLEDLPPRLTRDLGRLPIFPGDEAGDGSLARPGPLRVDDDGGLWLAPPGELGSFLRGVASRTARFVDAAAQARFGAFMERLGGRQLSTEAVMAAVTDGSLALGDAELLALHALLEDHRHELTPRLCRVIAATAVFPDATGARRPLLGPARALLAGDDDLRALLPHAPWVIDRVARRAHVAGLGVAPLGPIDVARALLLEGEGAELAGGPLVDPFAPDGAQLRRAYAYLIARGRGLPGSIVDRLAAARIWRDAAGALHALGELRRPPATAALAAFYAAWGAIPEIETGPGSAAELADALGLGDAVRAADHAALVADLRGLGSLTPAPAPPRRLLVAALEEAVAELPAREARALRDAPLFRDQAGVARPIRRWDELGDGCRRATGRLRGVLALGSRPLLAPDDEEELARVLGALDAPPAEVDDLITALESDPALARAEALERAREALAAAPREVALAFASPDRAGGHPRLQALPIWPTADGRHLPAPAVVRLDELRALLPGRDEALAPLEPCGEPVAVLRDDALPDAIALQGLFAFRDPAELIVEQIRRDARLGEPLEAQGPLLRHVDRVLDLLRLCVGRRGSIEAALELPLVVDGRGRLAKGLHFRATATELALARDLAAAPRLADTTWSAGAAEIDAALAPRLPARRLLAALAEAGREERPLDEHPVLGDDGVRRLLYEWLLERGDEIASDAETRGVLGRTPLIPAATGVLRAPRSLVLDPTLPDLGLGWGVHPEVPDALVGWLRDTFRLDEDRTRQLVEHVLEGLREAAAGRDVPRSAELLGFLGRVLALQAERSGARGAPDLEPLARRFKLHRAFKAAGDRGGGEFERPGRLVLADPARWALVRAFHADPPAHVAAAYDRDEQRALLLAAGARRDLEPEALAALLGPDGERRWLRPGPGPRLALARYLALRAVEEPSLRGELGLDRIAWVPDGRGELRRPAELFWPDAAVRAVLGDAPEAYPDPELVHASPAEVADRLPFRRAADIALDQVVERLERGRGAELAAPEAILDWLEQGLADKRLAAQELRDRLASLTFLVDDRGQLRAPADMVPPEAAELFGDRRGAWSAARRWPRLASALRITRACRLDEEIARFWAEVARDLEARGGKGGALLDDEPHLAATLPRCLARAAAGGLARPPDRAALPIACLGPDGQTELVVAADGRVALPEPEGLATLARELGLPVLVPVLPAENGEAVRALLRRAGVPDLWPRWQPRQVEAEPARSQAHAEEARRMGDALQALWDELPRLGATLSRPDAAPRVEAARRIVVEGVLHGRRGAADLACAWDRGRGVVFVTAPLFWALDELAALLCREIFGDAGADEGMVELVTELLGRDTRAAMQETLERRGDRSRGREADAGPDREARRRGARPRKPNADAVAVEKAREEADSASVEEAHAKPASSMANDREESAEARQAEQRGVVARLRRWLRGETAEHEQEQEPEHRQVPPLRERRREARGEARRGGGGPVGAARSHEAFFRPDAVQASQLRSAPAWLADRARPPEYGFTFSPPSLPLPWTYGVKLLSSRFDRRSQSWVPEAIDAGWAAPGGDGDAGVGEVRLRGRVPAGEVVLPVPLYGRVVDVAASPPARTATARDGRTLLFAERATDLAYRVVLGQPPSFEDETPADGFLAPPAPLLAATVPDSELPDEVLWFLDELAERDDGALGRALAVREFIRTRYRYDPSYLEDEGVARWLREVSAGRPNAHIAALHAGRDGRALGRGVCYDLNVLACELLRRAGVPAAVATGWPFTGGSLAEPDHLWAMALVPTAAGWRWYPIDAATTAEGRPLQTPRRPAGPWRVAPSRSAAPAPPRDRRDRRRVEEPVRVPGTDLAAGRPAARAGVKVKAPPRLPVSELVDLARQLEALTGERFGSPERLRKRFELLLRDPERLKELLALLRG